MTIPPVRTFAHVEADKALALKPLEEAAEAFGAWQDVASCVQGHCPFANCAECYEYCVGNIPPDQLIKCDFFISIVDECCDVIQATCNLLAALGVTDLTEAMAACERRNEERGRYE